MEIKHNGFAYKNLSYLEAWTDDITLQEGIYSWVYWPNLTSKGTRLSDFIDSLNQYKNVTLAYPEITQKFKFHVSVLESGFPKNDTLLGLSTDKEKRLLAFLKEEDNRKIFADFFQNLCFSRPFYVGKAVSLRSRLTQHFKYQTDLRFELERVNINPNQIWIGTKTINLTSDNQLSDIFEEILQRILKPGLTMRPG